MAKRTDLDRQIAEAAEASNGIERLEDEPEAHGRGMKDVRRVEAMSLRLAGLQYDQIGERLGIDPHTAQALVERNLERATNRHADQLRVLENDRLDRAQAAIWTKVLQGDLNAVKTFLSISQRRAKMNGLDAPKQIALSANVRVEMEQALSELQNIVLGEVVEERYDDAEVD